MTIRKLVFGDMVVFENPKAQNSVVGVHFSNPNRKNFGRPVKKQSRAGKRKLNKVGHRNNPTS